MASRAQCNQRSTVWHQSVLSPKAIFCYWLDPNSNLPFCYRDCFSNATRLVFFLLVFLPLWKGQKIFGSMMGFSGLPVFPYADEQSFGAYLGLGLLAIWITRKHLWKVTINVISKHTDIEKPNETIGYRIAVSLVIISSFFLMGFCHFSGMSMWVIVIFSSCTFCYLLVLPVFEQNLAFCFTICISWVRIQHWPKYWALEAFLLVIWPCSSSYTSSIGLILLTQCRISWKVLKSPSAQASRTKNSW